MELEGLTAFIFLSLKSASFWIKSGFLGLGGFGNFQRLHSALF